MGGGPRTFPGGLNKWQFKRMHEKMAREKERRLLEQEKEIYQARLRSQIRAKISGKSRQKDDSAPEYAPIAPADHVKTLADRFIKEGAEDLWNEDDGPLKNEEKVSENEESSRPESLDLRKMVSDRCLALGDGEWGSTKSIGMLNQRRYYSSEGGRKNMFNSRLKSKRYSDSDSDYEVSSSRWKLGGTHKFQRSISSNEDMEERDLQFMSERKMLKLSSAALMKHDRKKERRSPRIDEKEDNLDEDVEFILYDLKRRKKELAAIENKNVEDESLLTHQR